MRTMWHVRLWMGKQGIYRINSVDGCAYVGKIAEGRPTEVPPVFSNLIAAIRFGSLRKKRAYQQLRDSCFQTTQVQLGDSSLWLGGHKH